MPIKITTYMPTLSCYEHSMILVDVNLLDVYWDRSVWLFLSVLWCDIWGKFRTVGWQAQGNILDVVLTNFDIDQLIHILQTLYLIIL